MPTTPPGRTSQQLLDAPRGATFVWCTNNLSYVRAPAKHLGRADLVLVGKAGLIAALRGTRRGLIIVDHALWLTTEERAML